MPVEASIHIGSDDQACGTKCELVQLGRCYTSTFVVSGPHTVSDQLDKHKD
jgi:hypothetical protein